MPGRALNRAAQWLRGPAKELGGLLGIGLASALLLAFGMIAEEVLEGDATAFDRRISLLFRDPADLSRAVGPVWLPEVMRDLTGMGSTVVLGFVLAAVLGYLLLARQKGTLLLVVASVLGGQLISTLLKTAFARPRPDLVANAPQVFTASFPSGHAMLSAVTYLTLGALLMRLETERRLKAYFLMLSVVLTVSVGVSRVYLGVHWPTDVLAGWCVGSAWAILCWTAAHWLQRRRQVGHLRQTDPNRA